MCAGRRSKNERHGAWRAAVVTPGGTFERVLAGLRQRLGTGAFALGDPLEPAHLADELNASITPVRDALHRLVGERLVETAPSGGFRYPLLTEVGLRHLYDWNHRIARAALADAQKGEGNESGQDSGRTDELGANLFALIGERSGNPECVAALAAVSDRLERVRRAEIEILGRSSVMDEIASLTALCREDNWATLRRGLRHYHRRRIRITCHIIASLHRHSAKEL